MPRWEPGDFKIAKSDWVDKETLIAEATSGFESGIHRSYRQAAISIVDRYYYRKSLGTADQRETKIDYLATKIRMKHAS